MSCELSFFIIAVESQFLCVIIVVLGLVFVVNVLGRRVVVIITTTGVIHVIILRLHVVLVESKLIHILIVVVWIIIVVTTVRNGRGLLKTLDSSFKHKLVQLMSYISPSPGQQA